MKVTIDTNIIFQALYSNSGASNYILKLIREEKLQLALSVPVFKEYSDVLLRTTSLKKIGLLYSDIEKVLDFIAYIGYAYDIHFLLRPNLRDEDDNIFVELAFTSNSKYLITSNVKDYLIDKELIIDNFEIITPSDFVKRWRKYHE